VDRSEAIRDQIRILSKIEGFFEASVMFALLRLDLFEALGQREASIHQLSRKTGADSGRLGRLLRCAATMGFLESRDGENFALSKPARVVLLKGSPEYYLGDWLHFLHTLYGVFGQLDEAVLAGNPILDLAGELEAKPGAARSFNRAMDTYARLRGRELGDHLDLSGATSLLDLGCGPGTYAYHLAVKNPRLELYLADLPAVIEETSGLGQWANLQNPIHYLPLDILKDELPGSYDVILVSNTLHMLGHQASRELMSRLFPRVKPGGSLVVQAQFLGSGGLGNRWPAILDLIMLCGSQHGENHTVEETCLWLREAGFGETEHRPLSLLNTNSYVRAHKPVRSHQ
jgi:SAM-dependent methyltransferase